MAVLIDSLNEEHQRMTKLLSLMEGEIRHFQDGNVLDYMLITSILDYLAGVAQYKLHIAEEEIYRFLEIRDPEGAKALGDIRVEHEKIAFLSDTLCEAVNNIEQDNELPRMWLASVAKEFCGILRSHFEAERKDLFPRSLKKLTSKDWESIDAVIAEKGSVHASSMENRALHDLRYDITNWKKEQPTL